MCDVMKNGDRYGATSGSSRAAWTSMLGIVILLLGAYTMT